MVAQCVYQCLKSVDVKGVKRDSREIIDKKLVRRLDLQTYEYTDDPTMESIHSSFLSRKFSQ